MRVGYTEFSFGYAFTENLTRWARPPSAPVFPNLIQEGRYGYDVKIDYPGCPLFFQYKLPELMVRKSASEISTYALPGVDTPFFRTYLMKRDLSRQHELLINLENQRPNSVYYATSALKNCSDFNAAYDRARVHLESVFFSPKQIGPLPDDKQHSIAFGRGLKKAWLCSEPLAVTVLRFEEIANRLSDLFEDPRYSTLRKVARNLLDDLQSLAALSLAADEAVLPTRADVVFKTNFETFADNIRQRIHGRMSTLSGRIELDEATTRVVQDLLVAREIARVLLGVDLVIAQAPR